MWNHLVASIVCGNVRINVRLGVCFLSSQRPCAVLQRGSHMCSAWQLLTPLRDVANTQTKRQNSCANTIRTQLCVALPSLGHTCESSPTTSMVLPLQKPGSNFRMSCFRRFISWAASVNRHNCLSAHSLAIVRRYFLTWQQQKPFSIKCICLRLALCHRSHGRCMLHNVGVRSGSIFVRCFLLFELELAPSRDTILLLLRRHMIHRFTHDLVKLLLTCTIK